MGKYQEDAKLLLEYVGGKENIAAVSHCVSRMRFVLNDPAKADVAKIEALKSAKGTFTQAGQFQVIIGNTVSDFYNDFIAVSGIDGVSKDAVKSAAKQNQNALQKVMSVLAEIFAPLIHVHWNYRRSRSHKADHAWAAFGSAEHSGTDRSGKHKNR